MLVEKILRNSANIVSFCTGTVPASFRTNFFEGLEPELKFLRLQKQLEINAQLCGRPLIEAAKFLKALLKERGACDALEGWLEQVEKANIIFHTERPSFAKCKELISERRRISENYGIAEELIAQIKTSVCIPDVHSHVRLFGIVVRARDRIMEPDPLFDKFLQKNIECAATLSTGGPSRYRQDFRPRYEMMASTRLDFHEQVLHELTPFANEVLFKQEARSEPKGTCLIEPKITFPTFESEPDALRCSIISRECFHQDQAQFVDKFCDLTILDDLFKFGSERFGIEDLKRVADQAERVARQHSLSEVDIFRVSWALLKSQTKHEMFSPETFHKNVPIALEGSVVVLEATFNAILKGASSTDRIERCRQFIFASQNRDRRGLLYFKIASLSPEGERGALYSAAQIIQGACASEAVESMFRDSSEGQSSERVAMVRKLAQKITQDLGPRFIGELIASGAYRMMPEHREKNEQRLVTNLTRLKKHITTSEHRERDALSLHKDLIDLIASLDERLHPEMKRITEGIEIDSSGFNDALEMVLQFYDEFGVQASPITFALYYSFARAISVRKVLEALLEIQGARFDIDKIEKISIRSLPIRANSFTMLLDAVRQSNIEFLHSQGKEGSFNAPPAFLMRVCQELESLRKNEPMCLDPVGRAIDIILSGVNIDGDVPMKLREIRGIYRSSRSFLNYVRSDGFLHEASCFATDGIYLEAMMHSLGCVAARYPAQLFKRGRIKCFEALVADEIRVYGEKESWPIAISAPGNVGGEQTFSRFFNTAHDFASVKYALTANSEMSLMPGLGAADKLKQLACLIFESNAATLSQVPEKKFQMRLKVRRSSSAPANDYVVQSILEPLESAIHQASAQGSPEIFSQMLARFSNEPRRPPVVSDDLSTPIDLVRHLLSYEGQLNLTSRDMTLSLCMGLTEQQLFVGREGIPFEERVGLMLHMISDITLHWQRQFDKSKQNDIEKLIANLFHKQALEDVLKRDKVAMTHGRKLSVDTYASYGLERNLIGYITNSCATKVFSPALDNPNLVCFPFVLRHAPISVPMYQGGTAVIVAELSPGRKCLFIRGFNPRSFLLSVVDPGDLFDAFVASLSEFKRACDADVIVVDATTYGDCLSNWYQIIFHVQNKYGKNERVTPLDRKQFKFNGLCPEGELLIVG